MEHQQEHLNTARCQHVDVNKARSLRADVISS